MWVHMGLVYCTCSDSDVACHWEHQTLAVAVVMQYVYIVNEFHI